jgi:hypothetical protein
VARSAGPAAAQARIASDLASGGVYPRPRLRGSPGALTSRFHPYQPGGVWFSPALRCEWPHLLAQPSAARASIRRKPEAPGVGRFLRPWLAVCFCGTFLRVAPTGRYPAPCPMKPGLSSSKPLPAMTWRTPRGGSYHMARATPSLSGGCESVGVECAVGGACRSAARLVVHRSGWATRSGQVRWR